MSDVSVMSLLRLTRSVPRFEGPATKPSVHSQHTARNCHSPIGIGPMVGRPPNYRPSRRFKKSYGPLCFRGFGLRTPSGCCVWEIYAKKRINESRSL